MKERKNEEESPRVVWPEPSSDHKCSGLLRKFKAPLTKYYNELLLAEERYNYDIHPNLNFDLRFYFPPTVADGQKVKHLIIMYNGFDEFLPEHLGVYNRLGSEFALKNMASVLFPTPFHMNRASTLKPGHELMQDGKSKRPTLKRPSHELMRNPFWVYVNFIQTLHEYNKFKSLISSRFRKNMQEKYIDSAGKVENEDDDIDFYQQYFEENLDISLLGYSLGGLKALTCFRDNPDHPKSCILLNSGATIDRIRMKGIMDINHWRSVTDSIVTEQYPSSTLQSLIDNGVCQQPDDKDIKRSHELLKSVRNDDNYAEVRKVLIGTRPFNERDKQVLSRKLVIVIGGRDKIIPPEEIRRLEPEGSSLNVLNISDLGHFPDDDAAFNRWCTPTVDLLVQFIQAPEGTSLSKSQICSLLFAYDWLCGGTLLSEIENDRRSQLNIESVLRNFADVEEHLKKTTLNGFHHTLKAWRFKISDANKRKKELDRYKKRNVLRFGDIVSHRFGYNEPAWKEINKLIATKANGKKTGAVLTEEGFISEKLVDNVLRLQGETYRSLMEEFPEGREWLAPIIKIKIANLNSVIKE